MTENEVLNQKGKKQQQRSQKSTVNYIQKGTLQIHCSTMQYREELFPDFHALYVATKKQKGIIRTIRTLLRWFGCVQSIIVKST